MNDFGNYIEEIKIKSGIKRDKELALKLGITPGFVSMMISGHAMPSDELCIKIAKFANDNPEKIILLAHKNKASEETKPYWSNIIKTLTAATLSVYIILPHLPNIVDEIYLMSTLLHVSFLTKGL